MHSLNPKLITLAREYRGKTQTQLSNEIPGLVQGNLSRMEKGILNVTDEVIEKIAENLNFPKSFFYSEHVKTPVNDFYYRKRVSIPKKELSTLEAKIDIFRMIIDRLLESVDIPQFNIPQYNLEFGGTPEQVARKTRQFLKLERGPIQNLIRLLERHGLIILPIGSASEKFDGITTYSDSGQPIMFINDSMPNDRKRFTISHELAHLILHIPFTLSPDRDEEDEANRFAAEFNMPELDSRNDLIGLRLTNLGNLKQYWKVSMAFIIKRAKDLGAIKEAKAKNLMIELSRRGWRKREPGNVYLDTPILFSQIINTHIQELGYNENELASILNLDYKDFQNLVRIKKIVTLHA